jgi:pimeloyl-ACP methyl ester carboxylesterase
MRVLFGPAPTDPAFDELQGMIARPETIRASASESALLVPSVVGLPDRTEELRVPVAIVAGADDRFVGTEEQSRELHRRLPGSDYSEVPGAGHMVHHTAPQAVVDAIDDVARRIGEGSAQAA